MLCPLLPARWRKGYRLAVSAKQTGEKGYYILKSSIKKLSVP
ncbi:hypothetical protein ASZ90_018139 [hydrocarbon metagenome]|uniref:Uncharacterized protein n=1 Tax=hydrocarbon metagenome TaxID=938273 RepID=A0A0W8E755_9ZZZZ